MTAAPMTDALPYRDHDERIRRDDRAWRLARRGAVAVALALTAVFGSCAYQDHLVIRSCQREHWGDQPAYATCLWERGQLAPTDGPWRNQ